MNPSKGKLMLDVWAINARQHGGLVGGGTGMMLVIRC